MLAPHPSTPDNISFLTEPSPFQMDVICVSLLNSSHPNILMGGYIFLKQKITLCLTDLYYCGIFNLENSYYKMWILFYYYVNILVIFSSDFHARCSKMAG